MLDWPLLIETCAPNVAPGTMARIIRQESGMKPFAIGVNGEFRLKRQPSSAKEAAAWADWLIKNGYNIDMGAAQINSANLNRLGLTTSTVFDPCTNIKAAGALLTENYRAAVKTCGEGQAALQAALSMYNTGRFKSTVGARYVLKLSSISLDDSKVATR